MARLVVAIAAILTVAVQHPGVAATCAGDCGGDGEVTVDELVLGVNIALGSAAVGQCAAMDSSGDGEVTIDELIAAVNSALNGCTGGTLAGDYSGMVTFDATHRGAIDLTADASGQVSGSLVVTSSARTRFRPNFSFTFPVGGVSVSLSGTYDLAAGGFEVAGSFVDAAGTVVDVVISGTLPGPIGSALVNVHIGSDVFSATLSTASAPTPTPTVGPTPPPGNGPRIVYAGGLPSHIYVINVDGSGKTQISTSVGNDTNPAWSPDGAKIAFSTPYKTGIGIAVMNADGSNVQVLTTEDSPLNYNAAWSPDGSQIVFTAAGGDAVDIMNADGSNRRRLVTRTFGGESFGHLSWSPDGSRIAPESTRPRDSGHVRIEIWVMNADGSNFVRLTTNEVEDHHPDWSPNGQKIVFGREATGGVYSINPDGSGETLLISDPFVFGVASPNWSHDGQQLAYQTLFGLKVTDANGANAVTVPGTNFIADFDLK